MHTVRTTGWMSWLASISVLSLIICPFYLIEYQKYDLSFLNRAAFGHLLPANSFQHRISAHYVEVNQRYLYLMGQEMQKMYEQISHERQALTPEEQAVKYSPKDYQYQKPKNV